MKSNFKPQTKIGMNSYFHVREFPCSHSLESLYCRSLFVYHLPRVGELVYEAVVV